ncbi:MAG: LysM peptidoglycan-binding domain-containing protein [Firmicutes bacterium]|nr:LysM peptidoglycan-binding domain-containing protein [Bacillota bacterium]
MTRKRYRIVNKVRFTAFVCAMILLIIFAGSALFGYGRSEAMDIDRYIEVKVQPGDTLWSLASAYGPTDQDVRNVICEIEDLNGISASSLQAGQYLTIPVK